MIRNNSSTSTTCARLPRRWTPGLRSRDMNMAWDSVSAAVERLFGLQLREERLPDLKRALQKAAHELGLADREACAKLLLAGNLDNTAMEVLAGQLTVGETYFFR